MGIKEDDMLACADRILESCHGKKNKIFDGFMPFMPQLYGDEGFVFMDVTVDALEKPVNMAMMIMGDSEFPESDWRRGDIWYRFREITKKELRKRTGAFSPYKTYCLEVGGANVPGKSYVLNDAYFNIFDGDFRLVNIPGSAYEEKNPVDGLKKAALLCMGAQFNLENQNYVYLRPEDGEIGFRMPLETLGQVKELFKMRDIPDGRRRRVALRHWVASHMRRKPTKPDEQVAVREYLRGAKDFSWNGIEGRIVVNY